MDIQQVLTQHNQSLETKEAEIRGRLEILKEELLKLQAKREHNNDLIAYVKQQETQNGEDNSSTISGSEE